MYFVPVVPEDWCLGDLIDRHIDDYLDRAFGRETRSGGQTTMKDEAVLKESVAVHQAGCSCHPVIAGDKDGEDCCGYTSNINDVPDSAGNPWHIDQLCKVRSTP